MAVPGQSPAQLAKWLASPGVNGSANPARVRGADATAPSLADTLPTSEPDVFESWRGVRNAIFIHCPAGLNHAVDIARKFRAVG